MQQWWQNQSNKGTFLIREHPRQTAGKLMKEDQKYEKKIERNLGHLKWKPLQLYCEQCMFGFGSWLVRKCAVWCRQAHILLINSIQESLIVA